MEKTTAGIVSLFTGRNSPAPSNTEYPKVGKKLWEGKPLSPRLMGVRVAGGVALLLVGIGMVIHQYRTDMVDEIERRKELGVISKEQIKMGYTEKVEFYGIRAGCGRFESAFESVVDNPKYLDSQSVANQRVSPH